MSAFFEDKLPWLMLPSNGTTDSYRPFFDIFNNKTYHLDLFEAHRKTCCGSSQGWLIMVDANWTISLLNPITNDNIQLPTIPMFLDDWDEREQGDFSSLVHKVVLSSSPACDPNGYIAMAIYGKYKKLAYYKSGDNIWTTIHNTKSYYEDVIYYAEKFYAVDEYGGIVNVDIEPYPKVTEIALPWFFHGNKIYLVGSSWGLLIVIRYISKDPKDCVYRTTLFQVYKYNLTKCRWFNVKNLGNLMLFLGQNHSEALSVQDFSQCKGNCIYFTDDNVEGHVNGVMSGHDFGVLNLEDNSIEPLPCYGGDSELIWPSPTWVKIGP